MKSGYALGDDGFLVTKKSPDAVLDYPQNWGDWLNPTENITSKVVTVTPAGLTIDSSAIDSTKRFVTPWLSGGTVGVIYTVTTRIVTDQARTDSRSFKVQVLVR
jgi:hypothetical protein